MLFEAGEPASKVCEQPVPTARDAYLYITITYYLTIYICRITTVRILITS